MDLSICDDWKLISGQASLTSLEDLKRVPSLPTEFDRFISSIYHFPQWQFCCFSVMVGSQCEPHFFFFLHNNNIIGHHHYSLIEKKKVPKRVGNDPSLFLLTVFGPQFKPSFIRRDFVNGEQIKYIDQFSAWFELENEPRNMSRQLVCSSNTDCQSQHLLLFPK